MPLSARTRPDSKTLQGIWQYVPKEGEGFPEDFVPFKEFQTHVTARYPKKIKA